MGQGVKLARQYNRLQACHLEKVHLPEVPRKGWRYFGCAAITVQQPVAQKQNGQWRCGNCQLERRWRVFVCRNVSCTPVRWILSVVVPGFLSSPPCSPSHVLGCWERRLLRLSLLLAARRLKPPYCTVIGKETCQYGQVLEQLTNFYQTINVFIYSL